MPHILLVSLKIISFSFFKVIVTDVEILSKISFDIFPLTGADSLRPLLYFDFIFKIYKSFFNFILNESSLISHSTCILFPKYIIIFCLKKFSYVVFNLYNKRQLILNLINCPI